MRTVGVEEEFLLLRESSPGLAPAGEAVVSAARAQGNGQFEHELKREQAELGSRPQQSCDDLVAELRQRRNQLAAAAHSAGVRLLASATSPLDAASSTTSTDRYRHMTTLFGQVARMQLTCGMHVHVAIDSPQEGVAVLDRIRDWLAALVALSANSPFFEGQDTGYASYRSILWGQWPTAGPAEPFGDVASYEQTRAALVSTGAALDDAMIYFDARLSARYPTVEVRVADVCLAVDDAGVLPAITRGLVATAAQDWADRPPSTPVRTEVLRAAAWRAARDGVTHELVNVANAQCVPAWNHIDHLIDVITPALNSAGDSDLVHTGLNRLRSRGTGADLQRRTIASTHSYTALADTLAHNTLS